MNLATHNGIITVQSVKTGEHRTFRIRTQPADAKFAPGERIISMLIGSDNESDYNPIGFVKDNGRVILWRRHRDSFRKHAMLLERLDDYETANFIKYNFEGRCRRCNRRLTTPESVETGIGPVCAAMITMTRSWPVK
jgi:hypothetical protein